MAKARFGTVILLGVATICSWCVASGVFAASSPATSTGEELMVTDSPVGHAGGKLVVALRSEPKTLNPMLAEDAASQDVIRCLTADLIDINRATQKTEPALAKSWAVSRDGKQYTLRLRRGIRFSDGQPLTADDVVFSFQLYLDEKIDSPQRDLLIVGGKPIAVEKIDSDTVRFTLAQPYAAADRLFDGFAILPRHLLESAYQNGEFLAGLGNLDAAEPVRWARPVPAEGIRAGRADRPRAQSLLLEAGSQREPAALSQRDRVFVRVERRRAGDPFSGRRYRHPRPLQRGEFCGASEAASRPSTIASTTWGRASNTIFSFST